MSAGLDGKEQIVSQEHTSGAKAPGYSAGSVAGDKSPAYLNATGAEQAAEERQMWRSQDLEGIPQGLKPGDPGPRNGTTEVVPFQNAATESGCGAGCTCSSEKAESASQFLTLEAVRAKLTGVKGKRYWRSIDELAGTPEFQAAVEREFPAAAQEWVDPVSRRGFMKLMGASMALAGLAGAGEERRVSADQGGRQSGACL
jgi:MoCo/4Fe-4S cofactor protein with predicted Tat translocation signal